VRRERERKYIADMNNALRRQCLAYCRRQAHLRISSGLLGELLRISDLSFRPHPIGPMYVAGKATTKFVLYVIVVAE
jgi:hypothetical protein